MSSRPGEIGPGSRSIRNSAISCKRDQCRESAKSGQRCVEWIVVVTELSLSESSTDVDLNGSGPRSGKVPSKQEVVARLYGERGPRERVHKTTTIHGRVRSWMRLSRYRHTNIWVIACNPRTPYSWSSHPCRKNLVIRIKRASDTSSQVKYFLCQCSRLPIIQPLFVDWFLSSFGVKPCFGPSTQSAETSVRDIGKVCAYESMSTHVT